jgi:putative ABC transport system permease protein
MTLFAHFLLLAYTALLRNRMQAVLAMLGMTVGVGALVTSVALGRGAQDAITDQLRAAGANMIIVTAGNYQMKREQKGGGIDDNAWMDLRKETAPRVARWRPAPGYAPVVFSDSAPVPRGRDGHAGVVDAHYEDDPMAVHDHPTAKQRLGDVMAGLGAAATLTRDDADAIRKEIPNVESVAAGVHENARVFAETPDGKKQWFTRLHGTEPGLSVIRTGWTFPHGTFLTQKQTDNSEQVMVLGRVVSERLFGAGVDPTGRTITMWNQPFRVVGVVDSRSWATPPTPGDDQFDAIYVPVSTVHRLLNLSKLNTITITSKSAGDTTKIANEITALLRKRHGIKEEQADDFSVKTQAQQVLGAGLPPELAQAVTANMQGVDQLTLEKLASSLQRANGTMIALLASVATVSLLVGGVGVMNLLLLSVTQRTREVGVRIALGARREDVALQFVLEAVLLSVAGGVLGTVFGVIASSGLERFFKWSAVVSPSSAAMAIVVAMVLGVAFGVYPARRAAALDPIEALRHE